MNNFYDVNLETEVLLIQITEVLLSYDTVERIPIECMQIMAVSMGKVCDAPCHQRTPLERCYYYYDYRLLHV